MFIPTSRVLHEDLATSYVLVDRLIEDLAEGGFSGVVRVVLRDRTGYVVIARGSVIAAIEVPIGGGFTRTSVDGLADRARRERGSLSVYGCSAEVATTIAKRCAAEQLYANLSTEFADPRRMIDKLSREGEREWFVEIHTNSGAEGLIHIDADRGRLLLSGSMSGEAESGLDEFTDNELVSTLLLECHQSGGMFDVFFVLPEIELAPLDDQHPISYAVTESLVEVSPDAPPDTLDQAEEHAETSPSDQRLESAIHEPSIPDEIDQRTPEVVGADTGALRELEQVDPARFRDVDPEQAIEAERMAEIKQLLGEIARVIDESTRETEQRNAFSMYLRAGQLKIADRYPFLDPFGAEFEYLAGEIAFVGNAAPSEFIAGVTEAMGLAVLGVAQSSADPGLVRSKINSELSGLLESRRVAFESFELHRSIEQIMNL